MRSLRHVCLAACAVGALSMAGGARAAEGAGGFDAANQAFDQGRDAAAIAGFDAVARRHGWSAPLLFDLGNAYARAGDVGRAVLSYERARLLAPRDPDLAANLARVRAQAGLAPPPRPAYERPVRALSATEWAALAIAAWWLGALALLARRRAGWRLAAAVVACVVGAGASAACALRDQDVRRAVVVERAGAPLRLSPFDTAAVEASASAGEELIVLGRHAGFVRVRDGQGRAGWVASSQLQPLVPRGT